MKTHGEELFFGDSGWISRPDGSHYNEKTGELITEDGSVYQDGVLIDSPNGDIDD